MKERKMHVECMPRADYIMRMFYSQPLTPKPFANAGRLLFCMSLLCIGLQLEGCKKPIKMADGGITDSGVANTASKHANQNADAGFKDAGSENTNQNADATELNDALEVQQNKRPAELPPMERVLIPGSRLSLLIPRSWVRKTPFNAPLISREKAESLRDAEAGPQPENAAKTNVPTRLKKSKKSKKSARRKKESRKARRIRRYKERKATRAQAKKNAASLQKDSDGLPMALWTSLKLSGRIVFTARPKNNLAQKRNRPAPRLIVEQDPWLPEALDIEDYARAQRRSALATQLKPLHVEVEISKKEDADFAVLRSVSAMTLGKENYHLIQHTFLIFSHQEGGGRHGFAFMVSFFEAEQDLLDLIVRKMISSLRFEED